MVPRDEKKMAFIIDHDLFYYRVLPFRLKNVGAIYQQMVNKIFKDQIGWNMVVYVDDMLVKNQTFSSHINDLEETFATLHKYRIKLNLAKPLGSPLESSSNL